MTASLHETAMIVDGLLISNFTRQVLQDMHDGGITAANCTCSIWEDTAATLLNVATWLRRFRDNQDLIMQVHTTGDISRAKELRKVGVFLRASGSGRI